MSFLTTQVNSRLANPGLFEAQVKNYFRKSNNIVQQNKTIADRVMYDGKFCGAATNTVNLFTGTYSNLYCNLEGSYVRPSSEHVLIYGIRFWTASQEQGEFDAGNAEWTKGFTDTFNPLSAAEAPMVPFPYVDVSLVCNGVTYLQNVTGSDWDSNLMTASKGVLWLNNLIVWPGQTTLEVTVSTSSEENFPDASAIRCDLVGIGLI